MKKGFVQDRLAERIDKPEVFWNPRLRERKAGSPKDNVAEMKMHASRRTRTLKMLHPVKTLRGS